MDFYAPYDDNLFGGNMQMGGTNDPVPMFTNGGYQTVPHQQPQPVVTQQPQFAQPPQQVYQQPQRPTYVQQSPQQIPPVMYAPPKPSFVDRMFMKRKEFMKLLILALIIVLALSIHGVVKYALKMSKDNLSINQMLAIKIGYVLASMLLIWIFKTMNSKENENNW